MCMGYDFFVIIKMATRTAEGYDLTIAYCYGTGTKSLMMCNVFLSILHILSKSFVQQRIGFSGYVNVAKLRFPMDEFGGFYRTRTG